VEGSAIVHVRLSKARRTRINFEKADLIHEVRRLSAF
jgi:hypothetical protein